MKKGNPQDANEQQPEEEVDVNVGVAKTLQVKKFIHFLHHEA
jgi:hypothetical protein